MNLLEAAIRTGSTTSFLLATALTYTTWNCFRATALDLSGQDLTEPYPYLKCLHPRTTMEELLRPSIIRARWSHQTNPYPSLSPVTLGRWRWDGWCTSITFTQEHLRTEGISYTLFPPPWDLRSLYLDVSLSSCPSIYLYLLRSSLNTCLGSYISKPGSRLHLFVDLFLPVYRSCYPYRSSCHPLSILLSDEMNYSASQ